VALLWASHFIPFIIRVSLGVAAPTLMGLYNISPEAMGIVLSGFSWSYMAGLPMIGILVDRFGPLLVMGIGSVVWGLSTLALPLATTAAGLFIMRAFFGIGHCMMIPAGAVSIADWVSSRQRALMVGLIFSAGTIGLAVGSPSAAYLLENLGWEYPFYVGGALSLLFTLLWFALYPKEAPPGRSPSTDEDEPKREKVRVPWLSLLRHRTTWGMAFSQMGYLYGYFFFITWIPGYLIMERGMTVLNTGMVASLPFLMGMVGTIGGGVVADFLIRSGVSKNNARKGMIAGGLLGATLFVITAAFTTQTWLAVALLTLCMGSLRMTTASSNSLSIDLAPENAVASLASIQSIGGNLGGLIAPILTGYIVGATGSFVIALVVAGGMATFSACSILFLVGRIGEEGDRMVLSS
jgi:MFS family permease